MEEYLKEYYEERAAIYEYLANQTREVAENLARIDTLNKMKQLQEKKNEND